jgi:hypothetical protein
MAWQLHYTSARSGPTGRAGFQFVAETPDLPPGLRAAVTPFMVYRPPPHAPLSPGPEELARFPVALAYDRLEARPVLVRCRYLGRDYSGRYGNFFAHAVVAEPDELEGLRPAELWRAPLWRDTPGDGTLPSLDDLVPGEACDPEALAEWLADRWDAASSYDLLARLIDAVTAVLGPDHGRVMLVADDTELIARWIAVVSYSLPVPACARMSFVTYSADPGVAPQRVVGTTPDVWESTRHDGPAFFVGPRRDAGADGGRPGDPPEAGAGRYARTAAACWRDFDFAGLDAIGELADAALRGGTGEPAALGRVLDQAATLLALCQGDETVTPEEEAGAAELLTRHGAEVPGWVWRDLAPTLPGMGFDLALAVMAWAERRPAPAGPGADDGPGDTGPDAWDAGRDADDGADDDGTGVRAADRSAVPDLADRCAARCVVLALGDPDLRARLPEVGLPEPALSRLAPIVEEALGTAPDLTEVAQIARLAERVGARASKAGIESAAAGCARRGAADLPAAMRAAPARLRDSLVAGALAGLEATGGATRAAVLTDHACDLLYDREPPPDPHGDTAGRPREGRLPPAVALHVLRSVGWRHPRRRLDVTRSLVGLGEPAGEIEDVLRTVWAEPPPSIGECDALLGSLGAAVQRFAALYDLPSRAFTRLAETGDGLDAPDTVGLARLAAQALPPGGYAVADAAVVAAYAAALRAGEAAAAARRLDEIGDHAPEASGPLVEGAFGCAAQRLALRPPGFRAALLAAAGRPARDRLIGRWIGARHSKAARNELVEVAILLGRLGAADPRLEEWATGLAARRFTYVQLDAHFREHRDLRAGLKELAARGRRQRRGG